MLVRAGVGSAWARLCIAVLGIAVQPVLVRSMGNDRYGAYATITTFAALASFADLGIGNGVISRLARLERTGDSAKIKGMLSSAFYALTCASVIVAVIGIVTSQHGLWSGLFKSQMPRTELDRSVEVYSILFGLSIPAQLGQKILIARQRGAEASIWLLATTLLATGLSTTAALRSASLPIQVGAVGIAPLLMGALQYTLLSRSTHACRPNIAWVRLDEVRSLLSSGTLFLVLGMAGAVGYQADLSVVAAVNGTVEAAGLAVAIRMFGTLQQLLSSALSQLWPAFAEALAVNDVTWVKLTLRKSMKVALVSGGMAAGVLALAVRPVTEVLFGSSVVPSWLVVISLALWTAQQTGNYPLAMFLNGSEALRFQGVVAVIMAISNLGGSVFLAKWWGPSGPVWSSLITHSVVVFFPSLIYVSRRMNLTNHDTVK